MLLSREGLPRTWSNPQLSSHIRPGLEPPRLQQAAFDDCVYAVDVMRNVAVKQGGSNPFPSARVDPEADVDQVERKYSLPARMLCQTSSALLSQQSKSLDSQNDASREAPAVAGRLEIRVVDSAHAHGEPNVETSIPAFYLATATATTTATMGVETSAERSVGSISTHHSAAGGFVPAATAVSAGGEEVSIFYDAQPTGDEETTFRTALQGITVAGTCKTFLTAQGGLDAETERLEVIAHDDDNESLHSPEKTSRVSSTRGSRSPQNQRRIGTVVPPVPPQLEAAPAFLDLEHYRDGANIKEEKRRGRRVDGETEEEEEEDEDEEDEEEEEDEEGDKNDGDDDDDDDDEEGNKRTRQDYQVLSEQLDEERRKISVINLNDLSAAFQASSRMRTPRHSPPPADLPPQQRRYSQDDRSHAVRLVSGYLSQMTSAAQTDRGDEEEASGEAAASSSSVGKGHRYDRDRDEETSSGRRKRQGVEKYVSDNSQLNLQFERRRSHRPQSSDMTGLTVVHHSPTLRHRSSVAVVPDTTYSSHPSYLDSRSRPTPQSSVGSSLNSSYEISRVRSSPSLVPSTSRFPFHYTPHPPTGNPPTLRELDAR